jgi:anti-sigma-K factor RskA
VAEDARAFGWREAILVGAIVAGVVLGLAIGTSLLPADAQRLIFRTPLLIVILVTGSAIVLLRLVRRPPEP